MVVGAQTFRDGADAPTRLRFGMMMWHPEGGIEGALADTLAQAGHAVTPFAWNERLPAQAEVLVACGPFGSLAPLGEQLAALPPAERPRLVVWLTEQLANPRWPEGLVRGLAMGRAWVERQGYQRGRDGRWLARWGLGWLLARANRLRYYGDLHWLKQTGMLSVLVAGSGPVVTYLRKQGFDPLHAVLGAPRDWWDDLGLERDIPVLWLGNPATARRRRLLARLRTDLRARAIETLMVDGHEHPYVFGQARTVLLNRTQVMVNFVREPWDNNGLRYFMAAANGALIVSEPTLPHTPFVPGVHLVEAASNNMADVIKHYLEDRVERERIVAAGQRLAREEHTTARSVARLLHRLDPAAAGAVP